MNGRFTGLGALVRMGLRRDRVKLPLWVLGIGVLCAYFAAALPAAYPRRGDLDAIAGFMQSPAGVLLSGPGYGWDDPTYASAFAGAYAVYAYVAAAFMGILLVARHTRAEEESGRADLVRAAVVGDGAPLAAAGVLLSGASIGVGIVTTLGTAASGFDLTGCVLFGAGTAVVVLVFGAVALTAAQLVGSARSVVGLASAVLGAAFVVRGVGDTLEPGGSALSWASPLAWVQQTRVFVDGRWWPLALGVLLAVCLVAAASVLQRRRDLGAALLPSRPGPARASRRLQGPFSLVLRLERGALLGWAAALVALGGLLGGLTASVESSLADTDNELLIGALGGDPDRLVQGYLATTVLLLAYAVTCYAVATVHRLAGEERSTRTEIVLAASVSRARWMCGTWLTSLLGTVILLAAAGLALGAAAALASGDWATLGESVGATLAYVPAIAVVVGVAALGYAFGPAWTNIGWLAAVASILVGYARLLIDLPPQLVDALPLTHVAQAPLEAQNLGPLAVMAFVAVGILIAALSLFRQRDLV